MIARENFSPRALKKEELTVNNCLGNLFGDNTCVWIIIALIVVCCCCNN